MASAAGGTILALCDVDEKRAAVTLKRFPEAKRYRDFRRMLEMEKGIDVVTASTPCHTHAVASLMAMSLGKHVYCQKPLTRTVHEARLMKVGGRRCRRRWATRHTGRADQASGGAGSGRHHRPGA